MEPSKCVWCGKARRLTSRNTGFPQGVDTLLESKKYPSVKMHFSCAEGLRTKVKRLVGEDNIENPLMRELRAPWGRSGE